LPSFASCCSSGSARLSNMIFTMSAIWSGCKVSSSAVRVRSFFTTLSLVQLSACGKTPVFMIYSKMFTIASSSSWSFSSPICLGMTAHPRALSCFVCFIILCRAVLES
jgi:hypothetical protein